MTVSSSPSTPLPPVVVCVQTAYRHWSPHSGYHQFIPCLAADFPVELHRTPYTYWGGPGRLHRLGRRVQLQVVTAWTTHHDIHTELKLIPRVARLLRQGRRVVLHFLDGERGCCLFFYLFHAARRRGRLQLFLSFHQPPTILQHIVNRPQILRRAAKVIVVGSSQLPFFSFLPPATLHHLPHGVDTDFFRPSDRHNTGHRTTTHLLTVGNYLRDFDLLHAIIDTSPPGYHFHIVGAGAAAHRFQGHPAISLHHNIPERELLALYQDADLGLMPLQDSTANNVVLEMMACGLPVVCNDVGSVADYTGRQGPIPVKGHSAAAFWQVITRLGAAPATERYQWRQAARQRALDFSWPAIARRFAALYQQAGGESGPTA